MSTNEKLAANDLTQFYEDYSKCVLTICFFLQISVYQLYFPAAVVG